MSKDVKSLYNKIVMFERLALYGNRQQFLKSLSYQEDNLNTSHDFSESRRFLQLAKDLLKDNSEVLNSLSGQTKNVYIKFSPLLQTIPSNEQDLTKQLSILKGISSLIGREASDNLLDKKPETLSLSIAKYVALSLDSLKKYKEQQAAEQSILSQPMDSDNNKTTLKDSPFSSVSKTISPLVQRALNSLLGIKLNPDGLLGPQTATALQMFRSQYNNNKNIADPSLYQDILSEYANTTSPIIRKTPF